MAGWAVKAVPKCAQISTCRGSVAANPVVLTDLKREFQSYLEANNLCQGQIPEELKAHVGSRIKLFEPKTHTGLGYAYAHQKINGRGRCAIDL